MNWSNQALKLTMGVGMLGQTAILADALKPLLGNWGTVGLLVVPFAFVVMVKPGEEIPAGWVKFVHGGAVVLYLALSIATVTTMAIRGFIPSDVLMGLFLLLGLVCCAAIVRAMVRGGYDVKSPLAGRNIDR
jgi:hypothetical protein